MASLTGASIASSYTSLLKLSGNTDTLVAGNGSNAIQVVDGDGTASPLYLNTDRLGIGGQPVKPLHILSSDNQPLRVESTDAYAGIQLKDNGSSTLPPLISALSDDLLFYGGHASSQPLVMYLDSSTAYVGLGTASTTMSSYIPKGTL